MFEYMTAQEAAENWNVLLRWVQRLCKGNRIEGAMNIEPAGQVKWLFSCPAGFTLKEMQGDSIMGASNRN